MGAVLLSLLALLAQSTDTDAGAAGVRMLGFYLVSLLRQPQYIGTHFALRLLAQKYRY